MTLVKASGAQRLQASAGAKALLRRELVWYVYSITASIEHMLCMTPFRSAIFLDTIQQHCVTLVCVTSSLAVIGLT
jgi:tetrahydromethanopterin S-methyltransferase subunit E